MSPGAERPNIVMIHCHDIGRHLGCYGRGLETPNIDKLAAGGVRFDRYFGTAPFCAPSRCSRMTGLYPANHGAMGSTGLGWRIRTGIRTLPMYMNEAGYDTHLFGLQHEALDPGTLGYRHVEHGMPNGTPIALDVLPKVQNFLREYDPSGRPFYVDVGFLEVHALAPVGGYKGWQGTELPHQFKPRYVGPSDQTDYHGQVVLRVENPSMTYFREYTPDEVMPLPYLPDRPGIRTDLADLSSWITCVVDVVVGRILDTLREQALEDNTVVIFTTDHGIEMPRAKGTLYDSGIENAFIMRYPARLEAGATSSGLLSNVDLLPTLVELVGGVVPEHIDGRSFLPLLEGREYQPRESIYAENTWHGWYIPMRAMRTERFKYIRNFDARQSLLSLQSRSAREVLVDVSHDFKPIEELYDLERDPHEQNNLASARGLFSFASRRGRFGDYAPGNPEYADVLLALRRQLRDHMEDSNDPLLNGPVPHPGFKHLWDDL